MKARQAGFTLIELVVVIVILGILAATALPKFVDLRSDAKAAAVQGVAGALSSASTINYGAEMANSTKGVVVGDCSAAGTLLNGGLPTGYALSTAAAAAGTAVTCSISETTGGTTATATFSLIGVA